MIFRFSFDTFAGVVAFILKLTVFSALILSQEAAAEYGCPDGHIPVNQNGGQGQQCVVDYNLPYWQQKNGGNSSPSPREVWAVRWGAIAMHPTEDIGGSAARENTKAGAQELALRRCGPGCVIKTIYRNQCAAVAVGVGSYSVNTGESIDVASARAMKGCYKRVATCKVTFTECSLPERVR